MSGGVSHLDTFDPKPALEKYAGQPMPGEVKKTQFNNNGTIQPAHWGYKHYGQSGLPISDMLPHMGSVADELCVIRSMTAKFSEHAQGNFFMHTGFPFLGYPSAGAWTSYGLGAESQDLPAYVVLQSGGASIPHGGVGLFGNGFLPAQHQASIIAADEGEPLRNITPREPAALQRKRLDFIHSMDRQFASELQANSHVEAAIRNYEMAYRMQTSVPELTDMKGEPPHILDLYGVKEPGDGSFASNCLLARRLVERGTRFVQLYDTNWDHHGGPTETMEKHLPDKCRDIDRASAALVRDLKQRGLLEDTLVIWGGEFGRTNYSQGKLTKDDYGRDHHPRAFTVWMAGGGIKPGITYGETDEFGYNVVRDAVHVHDFQATLMYLLGVDHEQLTFKHQGRRYRLTDVEGHVVKALLA